MLPTDAVDRVLADYPEDTRRQARLHAPRHAFHAELIAHALGGSGGTVVDVGGAGSSFLPICHEFGMQGIVFDQGFPEDDPRAARQRQVWAKVYEPRAIRVDRRDVIADGVELADESVDAVGCFGVLEHFHHSPRPLLLDLVRALRPGGVFLVGTPNCVHLRKRLTVPFGYGKWTALEDWYGPPRFRGHVREPDLEDLVTIVRDVGLVSEATYGRNWMGLANSRAWVRPLIRLADRVLRPFPTLCSDIYVLGRKP